MLNYIRDLEEKLKMAMIPACIVKCRDILCNGKSYKVAGNDFMLEILGSIDKRQMNDCLRTIVRWEIDIKMLYQDGIMIYKTIYRKC